MAAVPDLHVKITVDIEQAAAAVAILRLEMWRAADPTAEAFFDVTRTADDWDVALFRPGAGSAIHARADTLSDAVSLVFTRLERAEARS